MTNLNDDIKRKREKELHLKGKNVTSWKASGKSELITCFIVFKNFICFCHSSYFASWLISWC